MQLTLVAPLDADLAPSGHDATTAWVVRPMTRADVGAVGRLYFAAYPPGVAGETVEEATADVAASLAGEYGSFRRDASLVAEIGDELAAAVVVVDDPPWDDVPPGPFVIDLFTGDAHRGRGIGRALMTQAMHACAMAGARRMMLRVESSNAPALALYRSLGFVERDQPDQPGESDSR